MEKAILKTLAYADIFDYPLNIWEIHKWLIGRKLNLRQVEKGLQSLVRRKQCGLKRGYYFLAGRDSLVGKRKRREKQSEKYFKKVQLIGWVLRLIPFVKLVGVSGGLALGNADKTDDIDLFIIVAKKRLWMGRFFTLVILALTGQRRRADDLPKQSAGKFCLNTILTEDQLTQKLKDIYIAHEVLQMKVLYQKEGIYSKYLSDNDWVFKFFPNWVSGERLMIKDLRLKRKNQQPSINNHQSLMDYVENLAKWWQMKIMKKPQGMERIEQGGLYFYPEDRRGQVLSEYKQGGNF